VDIRDVAVGTTFTDVMTNTPGPVLVATNYNAVSAYAGNPACWKCLPRALGRPASVISGTKLCLMSAPMPSAPTARRTSFRASAVRTPATISAPSPTRAARAR